MIAANGVSTERSPRPSTARIALVATLVCWLLFASQFPFSLQGLGNVALLLMVGLDIVIGILTGWLAFLPTSRLDERQAALRDRAYRIGFRLVGTGVLLMVLLYIAGIIIKSASGGPQVQSAAGGFAPRTVVALVELLAMAPSTVIAWLMPNGPDPGYNRVSRWLPLLGVPAVAVMWLFAVVAAPIQSTAASRLPDSSFSMGDGTCGHLTAVTDVAAGFGGTARLEAELCWNRQQAFTIGDGSLPRPAAIPADEWSFMSQESGLTSCSPLPADTDFGTVTERCTGRIDADGTLHITMLGRINPLPGGIASRDVRVDLVVTRGGKVLSFG
jgi:hypothetical protein